jgi:hypothetical protein
MSSSADSGTMKMNLMKGMMIMKKFLAFTTVAIGIAAVAGYYTAKKMELFVTDEHDYDDFEA